MPTSPQQSNPFLRESSANSIAPLGRCGHRPLRIFTKLIRILRTKTAYEFSLTRGMLIQRGPPLPRESSELGISSVSMPQSFKIRFVT